MIIKKFNRGNTASTTAGIIESSSSSSSSSSRGSETEASAILDRTLWGNEDNGGDIDGTIHSNGSVYAHRANHDYEIDDEAQPPTYEDEPGDQGGSFIADEMMKAPIIRATQKIYLPYPNDTSREEELAPLIKSMSDRLLKVEGAQPSERDYEYGIEISRLTEVLTAYASQMTQSLFSHVFQLVDGTKNLGVLIITGDSTQMTLSLLAVTRQALTDGAIDTENETDSINLYSARFLIPVKRLTQWSNFMNEWLPQLPELPPLDSRDNDATTFPYYDENSGTVKRISFHELLSLMTETKLFADAVSSTDIIVAERPSDIVSRYDFEASRIMRVFDPDGNFVGYARNLSLWTNHTLILETKYMISGDVFVSADPIHVRSYRVNVSDDGQSNWSLWKEETLPS